MTCSYCKSAIQEGGTKCANCGAPVVRDGEAPDFRTCPRCHRKLLALASPACSYCGERLPEEYIKVREADLHRIAEIAQPSDPETSTKVDEMIRRERRRSGTHSSFLDLIDVVDLTDLFS